MAVDSIEIVRILSIACRAPFQRMDEEVACRLRLRRATAETPERLAFYERIGQKHLTPLWTSLAKLVTPEPVSGCQPASWSFAEIRAAMIEAGA